MKCKKVNKLLVRYLEGDLNEQNKSSIEKHLQECKQCEGELILLKQILETAKSEEAPSPSADYWASYSARLWQKIENANPSGERGKTFAGLAQGLWKDWLKPLRWAVPVFGLALLLIFHFYSNYRRAVSIPSPTITTPLSMVQTKPAKSMEHSPWRKVQSTVVSKQSTLINLANGIYEFYNPAVETTDVLDSLYAQAIDIESALKEEEKGYLSLIDELTNEEKLELITKIQKTLL